MAGEVTSALRDLLSRLTTFAVDWHTPKFANDFRDIVDYEPGIDREEADLSKANVVSSLIRPGDDLFADRNDRRHVVAIDLDIPAHLVASSTPGHSHLYIEVKGGIPHHDYMALLSALAACRVIEKGYAEVSQARGHSDLRLPWVKKGDPMPEMPKRDALRKAKEVLPTLVTQAPVPDGSDCQPVPGQPIF